MKSVSDLRVNDTCWMVKDMFQTCEVTKVHVKNIQKWGRRNYLVDYEGGVSTVVGEVNRVMGYGMTNNMVFINKEDVIHYLNEKIGLINLQLNNLNNILTHVNNEETNEIKVQNQENGNM